MNKREAQLLRRAVQSGFLTVEAAEDCQFLKKKFGSRYSVEEILHRRGYLDEATIRRLRGDAHGTRSSSPPPPPPWEAGSPDLESEATIGLDPQATRVAPSPPSRASSNDRTVVVESASPLWRPKDLGTSQRRETSGDVVPPPNPKAPTIAGYRIERLIGRTTSESLYAARAADGGKTVTLTVFRHRDARVLDERLLREREIARLIEIMNSPKILPIIATGREAGVVYTVSPYINGWTLKERLDAHEPPSLNETLKIARDIAEGLAAVSRVGLVHGDVRPANIVVDSAGAAVLTGFGKDGPLGPRADGQLDRHKDLHGLGLAIAQALAGYATPTPVPPTEANVQRPSTRVLADDDAASSVPQPVHDLVARLVASESDRRFESAEEAARALSNLVATLATPTGDAPRTSLFRAPGPIWRAMGTVAAASFLAFGVVRWVRLQNWPIGELGSNVLRVGLLAVSLELIAWLLLGVLALVRHGQILLFGPTAFLVVFADLAGGLGAWLTIVSTGSCRSAWLHVATLVLAVLVFASWCYGASLRRWLSMRRPDGGEHVIALLNESRLRTWRMVHVPSIAALCLVMMFRVGVIAYFWPIA